MDTLMSYLQNSQLMVFIACLVIGSLVIFKYSLDQFDKPTPRRDQNDPWKFVVPRNLTSPRQYLVGFTIYFGTLMLIFLVPSIVGPAPLQPIMTALGVSTATPATISGLDSTIQNAPNPHFVILIAFFVVGLNPNLPKFLQFLDFEVAIRRFAHRMAYIPKNMHSIFNFMRFSEFDLSEQQLGEAWVATNLRPLAPGAPNLATVLPTFYRALLLYVRAAKLAGDLTATISPDGQKNLNLDIFRQYRAEIQSVNVNLQAIHARLSELAKSTKVDRTVIQAIQGDLIKNLELLYVLFACALTLMGTDRMGGRLRAIGFTSTYPPKLGVPWQPILTVIVPAALVILVAWLIASEAFSRAVKELNIPSDTMQIIQLLAVLLVVHSCAIGQAMMVRTRLIGLDKYYSATGRGHLGAYARIFFTCAALCFGLYLVLNLNNLLAAFEPTVATMAVVGNSAGPVPGIGTAVRDYALLYLIWTLVPACCGLMTAVTLDRPSDGRLDRAISGALQGAIMGLAVLVALITARRGESGWYRAFTVIIYCGLGSVLGFMLPAAIRRYWRELEQGLPDRIIVLRTAVFQYFRDIQQFHEWLNTSNTGLDRRRPLDVLTEENGYQRLVAFIGQTRTPLAQAAPGL